MTLLTSSDHRSLVWLFLPVMVLCWNSTSQGGLAIGLADADSASLVNEMSVAGDPTSNEEGKSRVESRNGDLHVFPTCQSDTAEHIAATNKYQFFVSCGERVAWESSRVDSSYVVPPPLVVPISANEVRVFN